MTFRNDWEEAWRSCYQHVLDTGEDPLYEFNVKRFHQRESRFRLELCKTIGGLTVITAASRNSRRCRLEDLPQEVLDYCMATRERPSYVVSSIPFDEIVTYREVQPSKRFPGIIAWATFYLPIRKPRPEAAIQRDLKAAAKAALEKPGLNEKTA